MSQLVTTEGLGTHPGLSKGRCGQEARRAGLRCHQASLVPSYCPFLEGWDAGTGPVLSSKQD